MKVTVIVPVYNVEKYLSECIESILAQTHKNLEIILVDDGSTDSSPIICDSYAEKDNRIKVIHKQNGGLSDARNAGLEIMTGDYVTFIDSDDMINIRFVEILLDLCQKYESDMSYCSCVRYESETPPDIRSEPILEGRTFFEGYDAVNNFFPGWITPNVCNKMFAKHLFETTRFSIVARAEDLKVVFEILLLNKNIKVSGYKKAQMYYYRFTPGSLLGKIKPSNMEELKVRMEVFDKLKSVPNSDELRKSFARQTKYFTIDFAMGYSLSTDPAESKRLLILWTKKLIKDMWLPTEKNFFKKFEYYIMYLSIDMWKYMRLAGWKLFKIPLYRG